MRTLFLVLLLLSSFAYAKDASSDKSMLWPRITVWPNSVDLQISNFNNEHFQCSGPVYIDYESGRISSEYYFATVYAHTFVQHRFYPRYFNDRIRFARHSIFCQRI